MWIKCSERMPESNPGYWSDDVIALSNTVEVFRLACQGHYWQTTTALIESGSDYIVAWMPFPEEP